MTIEAWCYALFGGGFFAAALTFGLLVGKTDQVLRTQQRPWIKDWDDHFWAPIEGAGYLDIGQVPRPTYTLEQIDDLAGVNVKYPDGMGIVGTS